MGALRLVAVILLAGLGLPSPSDAQTVRYWGRQDGTSSGWLELAPDVYREVRPGTELPGIGRVKEVLDDSIVVEREATEAEKDAQYARGGLVHDVLEIHIIREPRRPSKTPPAPGPAR